MTHSFLAAGASIEVGQHPQATIFGLTMNLDTILGVAVAAVVVLALGFFVRAKITAGVPNGTQLFFETVVKHIRDQVESFIGVKVAPFLIPVALSVFTFLLVCNWISLLPLHHIMPPPTADVNVEYAIVALLLIWWHAAGFRRHGAKYPMHVLKGHFAPLAPMWIIEEIVHPVSLALRLFGNILGGAIMLSVLGLLPAAIGWLPIGGWKLFDMGIGALQAYLLMLLMISYFKDSMEYREEH